MNNNELQRLIIAVETGKDKHYHGDVRSATLDALEELVDARRALLKIMHTVRPVVKE